MLFTRTRCLPQDLGPRIMTRVKKTTPLPSVTSTPTTATPCRGGGKGESEMFFIDWQSLFGLRLGGHCRWIFKNTRSPVKKCNEPTLPPVPKLPPALLPHSSNIGVAGQRARRGQGSRESERWLYTGPSMSAPWQCYPSFLNLFLKEYIYNTARQRWVVSDRYRTAYDCLL